MSSVEDSSENRLDENLIESQSKSAPPSPPSDISTLRKHSMDYFTREGFILRTGYVEMKDWYLLPIREGLDNNIDFVWKYCRGENVTINVDITKDDNLFHVKIRNPNPYNIPVFEDLEAIFNYEARYGSKQDVHVISRGMLGDAMKQISSLGYTLLNADYDGTEFEDKQWNYPLIIRHNGKEYKIFLQYIRANQEAKLDFQVSTTELDNTDTTEKGISSPDILVTDNVANYEASFEPDYVRAVLMDSSSGKMVDEKVYKGRYSLQDDVLVTTTSDYIRERIRNGENETTEFKLSIDNELMETVDSFANTNGGLIILGVEDKGNIRGFIYVPGNESIIEKKIQGLVKSHCEPSIDLRFEWINLDNKSLLLVYISKGNDKPYLGRDKGIYIREREHDYIVNRLQLDKLYKSHSSLSPLNYES